MRFDTAIPVGAGGMGEVFKAWDPDLERFVAIKVLHHAGPEMIARLLREARSQAHVSHPGVCKVYDVGEEDGRPFIAMEFIEGRLLSEAAADLSLEQKVLVVQQVADAVQAAHAVGLVHRDLKPGNIILGRGEKGELRPYVLDFGLAREQNVAGLTVTGQVLGTPGYLSPEQARGEVSTLDRRTDVFSLGVVLFELLSGSLPFPGESAVEILVNLLQKQPLPLRHLAATVPIELETVVMKCLEKDRNRRYGSARELANDLGRFLSGEPVTARPTGRLRKLMRIARRHRALTAAVFISFLACSAAASFALRTRWMAQQSAIAAQRFGQEAEKIESVLLRSYLTPLHDLRPEIREVRDRMAWIEEEMQRLGGPAHSIGHAALGRGYLELGETEAARVHLDEAWKAGYDEPEVALALGRAFSRLYRDALERAATLGSAELREARRLRANAELRVPAMHYLAVARSASSHPDYIAASLAFFEDDIEAALDALDDARRTEPWFYETELLAGDLHAERYRQAAETGAGDAATASFEAGRSAYTAATAIARSDPRGYEGLCVLWSEALRHSFHGGHGDLEEVRNAALGHCGEALKANPDLPTPHLRMGRVHRYWADQLVAQRQAPYGALKEARVHLSRALDLDPNDPESHVVLGVTFRVEANWRAAHGEDPMAFLKQALACYERATRLDPLYTSAHLSRSMAELHIGDHLRRHGGDPEPHFERAVAAARRTVELEPQMVGGHVNLGIAYGQLAIHRRDHGREAVTLFEEGARELSRAIELNPEFTTAHFNLGELLVERAELALSHGEDPAPWVAEAIQLLDQALAAWPDWAPPLFLQARGQTLMARFILEQGQDPTTALEEGERRAQSGRRLGADPIGLVLTAQLRLTEARWAQVQGTHPDRLMREARELLTQARVMQPGLPEALATEEELTRLEAELGPG